MKYPGTNTYNTIKANDGSQNQLHFEIIKIFFYWQNRTYPPVMEKQNFVSTCIYSKVFSTTCTYDCNNTDIIINTGSI